MRIRLKLLFVLTLLITSCSSIQAQQRPYYTQYVLNPFVSNPALAGIENYWDVKFSYRSQWNGISGAPKTIYATAHGPFRLRPAGSETTSTVHSPGNRKTSLKSKMLNQPIIPHAGFGFTLLSDQAGPIDSYSFNAVYAYHLSLSSKASLSAGLGFGAQGVYVHTNELNFGNTNPIDPAVSNTMPINSVKPDMSIGLWLYSAFYFVGASAQNIIPAQVSYSQNNSNSGLLVTHASFIGGYKFFLNDKVNFIPSVMIRFVEHTPFNFDINAKFQYREVAWIGIAYRHSKNFAAMLGMNINTKFSFGYSYDLTTSKLKESVTGTHEIVVGMLLGKHNRVVLSPRNF